MNANVMVYGSTHSATIARILSLLPTAEGRTWKNADVPMVWKNADGSKNSKATAQRNAAAALLCCALVVCKGARYTQTIVRAFRHRGRTIYYWDGVRLFNVDMMDRRDKGGFTTASAQREEDLWAEQLAQKRADMDAALEAQAQTMDRLRMYASRLAAEAYAYTQTVPRSQAARERWQTEFKAIRVEHIRATSTLSQYDKEQRLHARRARLLWSKQAEALCDLPSTEDALHPMHRAEGITDFDRADLLHRAAQSRRCPAAE